MVWCGGVLMNTQQHRGMTCPFQPYFSRPYPFFPSIFHTMMKMTVKASSQSNQQPRDGEVDDSVQLVQVEQQQQEARGGEGSMDDDLENSNHTTSRSDPKIPIMPFLRVLNPYLGKDREIQLHALSAKFKAKEIGRQQFIKQMRNLVGEQLLKFAAEQLLPQLGLFQLQSPLARQNAKLPVGECHGMQVTSEMDTSGIAKQEPISTQGPKKKQQEHLHIPQTSPVSGSSSGMTSGNIYVIPHPQSRQNSHDRNMGMMPNLKGKNYANVPRRMQKKSASISHCINKSMFQHNPFPNWEAPPNKEQTSMNFLEQESLEQATEQQFSNCQGLSVESVKQRNMISGNLKDHSLEKQSSEEAGVEHSPSDGTQPDPTLQVASKIPSMAPARGNAGRPPKKPFVGQKRPLEALGSLPHGSSKEQKVSGAGLEQIIEQPDDVTTVAAVNLREDEEKLFLGLKENDQVSESSRWFVQQEEARLNLQKIPLQKTLGEILAKCGLKNISNDVEHCLSLCLEKRMRGLVSDLIRLSKERVDAEKPRHQTSVTSDVQQQILMLNLKAAKECKKKEAEAEKLCKTNKPEGDFGGEVDKGNDEGLVKPVKEEENEQMRKANIAVRAAAGGDDLLSKWKLMAEQAQREEGALRKVRGNHQMVVPQTRVGRTISIKDAIAVLEREAQMSKSTLIYQLYERIMCDIAAK